MPNNNGNGPGPKTSKKELANDKALASQARQMSVSKNLGLSAFGTKDSIGNFQGYNYTARGYGEPAKGEDRAWYDPFNVGGTKTSNPWSTDNMPEDMAFTALEQQTAGD